MHYAKKWVMRKCLIQGYEQVDLLTKKHRDDYWVEKRLMKSNAKDGVGMTSNKELIRNTIDKLIPAVKSFDQLLECLTNIYGWKIRVTDKTVTFSLPDMNRGIRGNKLGDGYGKAELMERIGDAIKEKIVDFDSKSIEELSNPILAKEEFERKQIEKLQEENYEKANELWKDTINNIDGLVYSHKWEYLNYLEEIKYRKASTLTLRQVKEPILSFEEFNEMMERESAMPVEAVGNVQDAVVVEEAEEIEETIGIEKNLAEDLEIQDISILESTVEEVAVMEPVIERPVTMKERAKEISSVIRNNYGRYDNVPVKVKAELFQFSVNDFEADMKRHSLVLKELNVRMYSSELYDDYMSVVDAMDKKPVEEQNVNYYNNEKCWNRSR